MASTKRGLGLMEYWNWLPGIFIVDESVEYTLPSEELSAYAGTEWADNDRRVFHGLFEDTQHETLIRKFLQNINELTGPGWVNWPFGYRQLEHATMCWIRPGDALPEILLLQGIRQDGAKFSHGRPDLYRPGDQIGSWERRPSGWDYRQAMRFVYQASLLARDGLGELAVVCAIASLENASAEILLFKTGGDSGRVEAEFRRSRFLGRFDQILPRYGLVLPSDLFERLRSAYRARNGVAHALVQVTQERADEHVAAVEDVLAWYLKNV